MEESKDGRDWAIVCVSDADAIDRQSQFVLRPLYFFFFLFFRRNILSFNKQTNSTEEHSIFVMDSDAR
jgi:hypothetical protein